MPAIAPVQAIHVEVRSTAGCPDQLGFVAQVVARSAHVRLADAAQPGPLYRVALRADGPGRASGRLEVRDEGVAIDREVEGDSCGAVASALALIIAMRVDPDASPLSPATAAAPTDRAAPASAAAPSLAERPTSGSASEPSLPPPWRAVLGAGATGVLGPSPVVMFGPGVFLQADRALGVEGPGVRPALELRLGAARAISGPVATRGGAVHFTWSVARFQVCPLRAETGAWGAFACAQLDAGVLSALGSLPKAADRPWIAGGAALRGRWVAVSPLSVELEVGAFVPFVRDQFAFEPSVPAYDVPAVGAGTSASVVTTFW